MFTIATDVVVLPSILRHRRSRPMSCRGSDDDGQSVHRNPPGSEPVGVKRGCQAGCAQSSSVSHLLGRAPSGLLLVLRAVRVCPKG
jgi:hypothetical protein